MKFLDSYCGTTCGLLFNFVVWFTCLCLVLVGYLYIAVNVYCFPAKSIACYSYRIVFRTFNVLFIFTLPGINLIVCYILLYVVFVSSWVASNIFTLGGVILAGINCDR